MRPNLLVLCASAAIGLASTARADAGEAAWVTVVADRDRAAEAITEASLRFGVPAGWIRAVIQAESGGDPRAVSRKGALGMMQVMPSTYAFLRQPLRLGADPLDVRDNILAGTAYLRAMFDRFGMVGMIGAYNAGPARWAAYLANAQHLPREAVAYLSSLAPVLGFVAPTSPPSIISLPPPSPFEAPIFVSVGSRLTDDEVQAKRRRVIDAIAANPSVILATASSRSSARASGDSQPSTLKPAEIDRSGHHDSTPNGLFPPTSHQAAQP